VDGAKLEEKKKKMVSHEVLSSNPVYLIFYWPKERGKAVSIRYNSQVAV
jgi:hypothetical protein